MKALARRVSIKRRITLSLLCSLIMTVSACLGFSEGMLVFVASQNHGWWWYQIHYNFLCFWLSVLGGKESKIWCNDVDNFNEAKSLQHFRGFEVRSYVILYSKAFNIKETTLQGFLLCQKDMGHWFISSFFVLIGQFPDRSFNFLWCTEFF